MKHIRTIMNGTWYWQRIEDAGRMIPQGHGIVGKRISNSWAKEQYLK